jgi:3-hydroxyacyl-CoA dehydrogenase
VRLADINPDVLDRSRIHIMSNLELFIEYRLISETPPAVASRITYFREISEAVDNCDFVVEKISEVLAEKKKGICPCRF